jgi:hypothetical protein
LKKRKREVLLADAEALGLSMRTEGVLRIRKLQEEGWMVALRKLACKESSKGIDDEA